MESSTTSECRSASAVYSVLNRYREIYISISLSPSEDFLFALFTRTSSMALALDDQSNQRNMKCQLESARVRATCVAKIGRLIANGGRHRRCVVRFRVFVCCCRLHSERDSVKERNKQVQHAHQKARALAPTECARIINIVRIVRIVPLLMSRRSTTSAPYRAAR